MHETFEEMLYRDVTTSVTKMTSQTCIKRSFLG